MTRVVTPAEAVSAILAASSVAIIGASEDGRKPSGRTVRYLQKYGFKGQIFPVNPRRDVVQGLPTIATIADVPVSCDVAVIVLPEHMVEEAVRECGAAGIPVAIVFAAGYSETGAAGLERERSLLAAARESGIRLLGPNCVGAVSAGNDLTATFMTGLDQSRFSLQDDGIAFVSQSGAMGAFVLNMAQSAGIGLGRFFSVGNEADLTFSDIVGGLIDEGSSTVIAGYVEGIRDGAAFESVLAQALTRGIPVCLMKVGTSARGAAAAASHTGALAGADQVYASVFDRWGVQRADSVEQLLDFTRMLAAPRRPRGERMTIVTLSGGAGALMTDYADDLGIDVFPWSDEWRARIQEVLPAFASTANPIDTTGAIAGDLELLSGAVRIGIENPDTDVLMVLLGNMDAEEEEACARIAEIARSTDKPIVVTWVGGSGHAGERLAHVGVPVFTDPARAMRAVAAATRWSRAAAAHASRDLPASTPTGTPEPAIVAAYDEVSAKRLLASYGVPTVQEEPVDSAAGAAAAAAALGYPVVVKLLSNHVAHKSDIGGVRLGLADEDAVLAAATDILAIANRLNLIDTRLVVQRAIEPAHEVILGMTTDPTFGPVVALGMGGVYTELLSDVQLGVAPLGREDAARMLSGLRGVAVLRGLRGAPPVVEHELLDAVIAFSHLAADLAGRVEAVEVNPLMIDRSGHPVAVDALIIPLSTDPEL